MSTAKELSQKYKSLLNKAGINTPLRLAQFWGQVDHESGLKPINENLNYSVDGLLKTFSRTRISTADTQKYGRSGSRPANQEAIANTVYGGEWGKKNLGNLKWGDGWNYRGKGFLQITGLSNYQALTKYAQQTLGLNVDYVKNPELLLQESDSLIGALFFWSSRNLNQYADRDDVLAISKAINLGNPKSPNTPKGLQDRINKVAKYKKEFGA